MIVTDFLTFFLPAQTFQAGKTLCRRAGFPYSYPRISRNEGVVSVTHPTEHTAACDSALYPETV